MWTWVAILGVFAVAAVWTLAVVATGGRHAKRALRDAPAILGATFSGPVATYKVNLESLPYEVVVSEAAQRGYRLVGQQRHTAHASTLVFERV